MNRRRAVVLALGLTLSMSACDFESELLFELFGIVDLSESDDPAEQAAATAADEVAAKQRADEALEDVMAGDRDAIQVARDARPADPKYVVYEALLHQLNGESAQARASQKTAKGMFLGASAERPSREENRRWTELQLDAAKDLLDNFDGPTAPGEREHVEGLYCELLRKYEILVRDDPFGQTYLLFVDRRGC